MIEAEDYDGAITLMKSREPVILNCKCMLKYIELSDEQKKEVENIRQEISELEKRNIDIMQTKIVDIKDELKQIQKILTNQHGVPWFGARFRGYGVKSGGLF